MSCRSKLLALSAAMLLSACATQPVPQVAAGEAPSEVKTPYGESCLRETGSRIRPQPGTCIAVPGRVYSSEDIGRTSAMGLGEALFRLGVY
jgi:hypothetical protein